MEPLITQLIKALGWSILHSLWQGAIIYALLFISYMVFSKAQSRTKHNIAFAFLLLTFISFCITFSIIFELPSQSNAPHSFSLTTALLVQPNDGISAILTKAEAYFPLLSVVYVLGLTLQTCLLTVGYVRLKKMRSQYLLPIPASWSGIFETTLQQLAIRKKVSFYLSTKVNVPLVIGFFKPVILFPIAMATQTDLKHVEAILIHELSHIRRNDYLLNLIKTTIEILMFFNPFVWLISKLINVERENACDDLVISVTQTPVTYAHALLNIELLKNKNTPALSLAATGNNQHLYQRIKRITNMKTNYMNIKQHALILTLAVTTVVSLAWINPTKKQTQSKKVNLKTIAPIHDINQIVFRVDTDSIKTKERVKIIIIDDKGKENVYKSMADVPDSIKKTVPKTRSVFGPDTAFGFAYDPNMKYTFDIKRDFDSPEFKLKMDQFGAEMEKMGKDLAAKFDNPEFKEKMEKMGKDMEKKYNSPEFKAKMKAMESKFNSPEFKAKIKQLEEKYNSPEFKAKMDELAKNSARVAEAYTRKFDSEDFKKKTEDVRRKSEELKKLYKSDDYKKLREQYEKDLEKLKKKNGISTDKAFLMYRNDVPVNIAFAPRTDDQSLIASFAAPVQAAVSDFATAIAVPTELFAKTIVEDVVKSATKASTTSGDVKTIKIVPAKPAKQE